MAFTSSLMNYSSFFSSKNLSTAFDITMIWPFSSVCKAKDYYLSCACLTDEGYEYFDLRIRLCIASVLEPAKDFPQPLMSQKYGFSPE